MTTLQPRGSGGFCAPFASWGPFWKKDVLVEAYLQLLPKPILHLDLLKKPLNDNTCSLKGTTVVFSYIPKQPCKNLPKTCPKKQRLFIGFDGRLAFYYETSPPIRYETG